MANRKLYCQIAKKHGTTAKEVKQEIQAALNAAYRNPERSEVTICYQNQVPRKGGVPTVEEFIRYAAAEAKKRQITND